MTAFLSELIPLAYLAAGVALSRALRYIVEN